MSYAYGLTTECTEMNGSPVEVATTDSFEATVTLLCPWAVRRSLADEVGINTLYLASPTIKARARSITITPYTSVNAATPTLSTSYECALVVVRYAFDAKTPDTGDDETLFSESLEPTAQYLTQSWESFKWKNGPLMQPGEAPGKLFRGMDYVFTRYDLLYVPATIGLVGCCNNAAITARTIGWTFAAETLLFNPPSLQRKVSIGPSPTFKWTVTYRLTYHPQGWNTYWNAKKSGGPGWDTIQIWVPGTGYVDYKGYPPASFSGI
jgi:hypothetical protein